MENWELIMDKSYELYEDDYTYNDFIKRVIKEFGEKAAFAVLMGKFNHQVCNGGHDQYYFNGYSGDDELNISMHKLLIKFFNKYFTYNNKITREYREILDLFEPEEEYEKESCSRCDGAGEIDEDNDEFCSVSCPECYGSGEQESSSTIVINSPSMDDLDNRYYKIEKELMKLGEKFFSKPKNLKDIFPHEYNKKEFIKALKVS